MASQTAPSHHMTTSDHSSDPKEKALEILHVLQRFFKKFGNDWSTTFASALAYTLLTAIVPVAIALISVLGFIIGGNNSEQLLKQAISVLPQLASQQAAIHQALQKLSSQAGFLAILAILTAVFGGSRLFIAMENSLDIIYRVRPRTFIPQNIMAILMMIVFIILVPVMIFAGTLPSILLQTLANAPVLQKIPLLNYIANNAFLGFLGGLLAAFLLFLVIYIVVPNQRINLKQSWCGALVSAIALQIFITIVFPFYTTHFLTNYNYAGQAGLAVVLLIFLYYFAIILMLGAEVNAFFFEKLQPIPNDLATFVSTMAGKLNHDFPVEDERKPHVDPKPTEQADQKHLEQDSPKNDSTSSTNSHSEKKTVRVEQIQPVEEKHDKQHSNRLTTWGGVALGTILTVMVELFRNRQRAK